MIGDLLRFLFLLALKILSRVFFRFRVEWVGHHPRHPFRDARIGLLLNHTSLFEPLFAGVFPLPFMWRMARRGLIPGANSTLDRPIVGRVFKWMAPGVISISRNRDRTWTNFLAQIGPETLILMAPEGRMKRKNGLDKHGRPMTVRGGIVDMLEHEEGGTLLLLYSGGLHHVQCPGEWKVHLFQRIDARFEEIPIVRYKKEMGHGTPEFRDNVIADLERRRDLHCPWD